jgi:tRNA threonylcarbamoyladenosine biosynthesis protein TsaE
MPTSIRPHLNLPEAAATARLGGALAPGAAPGRVLHLRGELGAGKTTLVRGLLQALGYAGRVKSPTYTLVEPYALPSLNLYHFDFYRLTDKSEWLSSGFQEYFNPDSVCVVEWPEHAGGLLPAPDLHIRLDFEGEARSATLQAGSPAGEAWLSSARSQLSASPSSPSW